MPPILSSISGYWFGVAFLVLFVLLKLYQKLDVVESLLDLAREHPGIAVKGLATLYLIHRVFQTAQDSDPPMLWSFLVSIIAGLVVITLGFIAVGVQNVVRLKLRDSVVN